MRFAFFILAFLFALEPLPAATAPVSVPRANAMQDARAPATPNATQAGQTVQAHLWETVLDLLPTLVVSRFPFLRLSRQFADTLTGPRPRGPRNLGMPRRQCSPRLRP